MKPKKLKRLTLNKKTVVNLNDYEKQAIYAGEPMSAQSCISFCQVPKESGCPFCPFTSIC